MLKYCYAKLEFLRRTSSLVWPNSVAAHMLELTPACARDSRLPAGRGMSMLSTRKMTAPPSSARIPLRCGNIGEAAARSLCRADNGLWHAASVAGS